MKKILTLIITITVLSSCQKECDCGVVVVKNTYSTLDYTDGQVSYYSPRYEFYLDIECGSEIVKVDRTTYYNTSLLSTYCKN